MNTIASRTTQYELNSGQLKFMRSTARGVVFRGGVGSGKSHALCLWAVTRCMQNRRVCLVSFSYRMLYDTLVPLISSILKSVGLTEGFDWYFAKADMSFKIWSNEILLRSADAPDRLRSLNLNDFGLDEGREFKDASTFDIMLARIRLDDNAQWRVVSTPRGKDWMYQLSQRDDVEIVPMRTQDSPFVTQAYIDELRSHYTSSFQRQELDAEIIEDSTGVICSAWFKKAEKMTSPPAVRFWDLAVSTHSSADRSSGALCSMSDSNFAIHNVKVGRYAWPDLRRLILSTAEQDGPDVRIGMEEAGQQLGLINDIQSMPEMSKWVVQPIKPQGNKLSRALIWASRAEGGLVSVLDAPWNQEFFDECDSFTTDDSHRHDDIIDSVSGAWQMLQAGTINFWTADDFNKEKKE